MKKLLQLPFLFLLFVTFISCGKSDNNNPSPDSTPQKDKVTVGSTAPTTATAGSYYFSTETKILYKKVGSYWDVLGSISDYSSGEIVVGTSTPNASTSGTYYVNTSTKKIYKKSNSGWAEIEDEIYIKDAKFKAALIDANKANLDIDKNGKISRAEAEAATAIRVNGNEIEDLSGIEFFKNITELQVNYNSLKTLDLKANTRLQKIYALNNSLEGFIDLSALTALSTVEILKNNNNPDVTGIKVSTADKATTFNVSDKTNKYTNTDVVDTALELNATFLECLKINDKGYTVDKKVDTNQDGIITVKEAENFTGTFTFGAGWSDAESKKALEELSSLDDLKYFKNIAGLVIQGTTLVTKLNMSNFPSITKIQFTDNAALKEVILSNLPKLTDASFVKSIISTANFSVLPALEKISLENNQLQYVDLSQLSALKTINLLKNNLQGTLNLSSLNLTINESSNIQIKRYVEAYKTTSNDNLTQIRLKDTELAKALNIDENTNAYVDANGNAIDIGKVEFPDSRLKTIIHNALITAGVSRTTTDAILKSDLEKIENLTIDQGVYNLSGLEYVTNLTTLNIFPSVAVIDLNPFKQLQTVTIGGGSTIHTTVYSDELTQLKSVIIRTRKVENYDFSKCTNLTNLYVQQNDSDNGIKCILVPAAKVTTLQGTTPYAKDKIGVTCP